MKEINEIYVIKITLIYSKPKIWRRVEISSNFTFAQLHQVIQKIMPWEECHLHQFIVQMKNPLTGKSGREVRIAVPHPDNAYEVESENKVLLHQYLHEAKSAVYEYDFGDSWEHEIKLEKIIVPEEGVSYPRCTGGEMACPPEDCGGIYSYYDMLDTINGKDCQEKEELLDWIGGSFDPNEFDYKKIKFPKRLLTTYAKK